MKWISSEKFKHRTMHDPVYVWKHLNDTNCLNRYCEDTLYRRCVYAGLTFVRRGCYAIENCSFSEIRTAAEQKLRRSRVIPTRPVSSSLHENGGNYRISAKSMERRAFRAVIVSTTRHRATGCCCWCSCWPTSKWNSALPREEEDRNGERPTTNNERTPL